MEPLLALESYNEYHYGRSPRFSRIYLSFLKERNIMEALWKALAKRANQELQKLELKRAPVSIMNQLHSMDGAMGAHFEVLGTGLVQRFNEITSKQLSDFGSIIREVVEDAVGRKSDSRATADMVIQAVGGQICGVEGELLKLVDKSERRQNHVMEAFNELSRQIALVDQSHTDRQMVLLEQFRQVKTMQDLSQGMKVRFHDNMTMQLTNHFDRIQPAKQRYSSAPSKEWFFDNIDWVMEVGSKMKLAKDNDAPRSSMKMELIRLIRSPELLWGATDVRNELDRLFSSWDNGQSYAAAA